MHSRWQLGRAGILNVYQYGDETLEFAGGRLLLRGVNGSGKSTAMNMILPFLLEADVRRIDAAGEQRGVLRSWMLADREEQQPIGYLWVEFERAGEYFVCGCGIRANRSTERVTTWWFNTSLRPGIDLTLVEGKVPLNADGLRFALGEHGSVYPHDQRHNHVRDVNARLFGGADLDQHLRLLHAVRNPRVGDRIDSEIEKYLNDALPQLSDAAIDDAAQPLESLEEHRRNVAALTATASTLESLSSVYRSYVSTELRGRATTALAEVEAVRTRERDERRARRNHATAKENVDRVRSDLGEFRERSRRLISEISAMKERPEYMKGRELEDLRARVETLRVDVTDAESRHGREADRLTRAEEEAARTAGTFDTDLDALTDALSALRALCAETGIRAEPPDVPTVDVTEHDGAVGPAGSFDDTTPRDALSHVRTAITIRRDEIDSVRRLIDTADSAAGALMVAEAARDDVLEQLEDARSDLKSTMEDRTRAVAELRAALHDWVDRAVRTAAEVGSRAAIDATGIDDPTFVDAFSTVRDDLRSITDSMLDELRAIRVDLQARSADAVSSVQDLTAQLSELESRTRAEIPRSDWQRHLSDGDGPLFAEMIDFVDGLDEPTRLGLEAALEAAGLLSASITPDGLRAVEGDLLIRVPVTAGGPTPAVGASRPTLGDYLCVTAPDGFDGSAQIRVVEAVLDAISTDPSTNASTVISPDGWFRIGVLEGCHSRQVVEHVGATARAAALERQRVALRERLINATALVDELEAQLTDVETKMDTVVDLSKALPPSDELDAVRASVLVAETMLERARAAVDTAVSEVTRCEEAHADALETAEQQALASGLPHTPASLDDKVRALDDASDMIRSIGDRLTLAARSCRAWSDAVEKHRQAISDVELAGADVDRARSDYEPVATRLATLEHLRGADYEEIVAAIDRSQNERRAVEDQISSAEQALEKAIETSTRADSTLKATEHETLAARDRCTALLSDLRDALSIPGVWTAAIDTGVDTVVDEGAQDTVGATTPGSTGRSPTRAAEAPAVPAVPRSVDGIATLAEFILVHVPEPSSPTSAEGVRQSLRQRRDSLGAGWDAEDRHPDPTMPLQVDVNGPIGRMALPMADRTVHEQLTQQMALLSAKEDQALRNLLQGLIATEVSAKLHGARLLVEGMNQRLAGITTAHGIGAKLRWRQRGDLDEELAAIVATMSIQPGLRTDDQDAELASALSRLIEHARRADPEASYRQLVAEVLDYRTWYEMTVLVLRPGQNPEKLSRRTALSEGEKKVVSYLPLFAAIAASCDALSEYEPDAPRFVLLDDAFAKVSEDNHPKLFGLLVDLDLDFIATSERLWGTHDTVPELSIIEVIRDADLAAIVLEKAHWRSHDRTVRS